MESEKSTRYGNSTPSLFPLFEGQLKQNLVVCKYVTNSTQNHNRIDDVITDPCNYVILCFRVKVQLLTNFSIFRGIKRKFGGGVNSETLISYFMSILPHKMNLIKLKVCMPFFTKFIRPLFSKCCHGNIVDDISIVRPSPESKVVLE